ncbi:twin-arginine translocase TatA/TatE family subunit [bacterium]|nr:twin-arginine translocase TatA/TatE family subunit [bacterium]NUN44448.1 twin-arginine translocase TatA/TatE family subunit [bacterium]HMW34659.1 twin-arginine translocase TatA/TatE family subunit [bacterium]HMY36908.1 twin-arginine translocase TatA/TatE family subunit [bacterium]HMZ05861.1 twin-arginine translocase TatA/TatE family subunit [bacterium]
MNLGMPEIIVIAVAVLILFGAKKIPEFAQGLGKGIREFKRAMNGAEDEIKKGLSDNQERKP